MKTVSRIAFGLLVALVLVMANGTALVAQGQVATNTPMPPTATPTPPCPSGYVDSDGTGGSANDDNGDCRPITQMLMPTRCGAITPPASNDVNGSVFCVLDFGPADSGVPFTPPANSVLRVTPGCVNVDRDPYPRLMANVGGGTLELGKGVNSLIIPTHSAIAARGEAGWYARVGTSINLLGGHWSDAKTAGNWYGGPLGTAQRVIYDPVAGLPADTYPSIRNVSARLIYQLVGDVTVRLPGADSAMAGGQMVLDADGLTLRPIRSSGTGPNSGNSAANVVASGGPNWGGANNLPAYRLQVESRWQAWLEYRYEIWQAVDGSYVQVGPTVDGLTRIGALPPQTSYRAWDARQSISAGGFVGEPYCNATVDGYIPIPVMEGQAVLER